MLNFEQTRSALLSKPEAIEDYPFGPDVMVFKVTEKMFATLSTSEGIGQVNLKCDPDEALALRDIFTGVIPGYHMNKKHWNTVILDGSVSDGEILRMIDNSYSLVVKSLPKAKRQHLELTHGSDLVYR